MGCFKVVLGKLKKDVQKKMGNMPTFKRSDDKFERMSEERSSSKKSLSDLMLPDWMEDPRVPMDFTQGIGRIVHDEAEIEQIKREPKQMSKIERFEKYENFPKEALEHGRHLTQKYYHGDLSRSEAEKMLVETYTNGQQKKVRVRYCVNVIRRTACLDLGCSPDLPYAAPAAKPAVRAWLLRDSHARTNCLTISYLYEGRVHHKYVSAASHFDEATRQRIYVATLDQQLAFYDVHSLTEFYRLNKGNTMMCMLTTSVKKESQRDSSPARNASDQSSPVNPPVPIDLTAGISRDPFNRSPQSVDGCKSPRTFKDFFSKPFQKSKHALKTKRLSIGDPCHDQSGPSTSKDDPLDCPCSSSQEPSSSGISSNGGQSTPESPPSSSQDGGPPLRQPGDPPTTSKISLA